MFSDPLSVGNIPYAERRRDGFSEQLLSGARISTKQKKKEDDKLGGTSKTSEACLLNRNSIRGLGDIQRRPLTEEERKTDFEKRKERKETRKTFAQGGKRRSTVRTRLTPVGNMFLPNQKKEGKLWKVNIAKAVTKMVMGRRKDRFHFFKVGNIPYQDPVGGRVRLYRGV